MMRYLLICTDCHQQNLLWEIHPNLEESSHQISSMELISGVE